MNFSERQGYKPIKALQVNTMDMDLRNSIWNVINLFLNETLFLDGFSNMKGCSFYYVFYDIWYSFLKIPTDNFGDYSPHLTVSTLKEQYYSWPFWKVYDFIEFIGSCEKIPQSMRNDMVVEINNTLKREVAGVRFIDNQLVPITNETEVNEINEVLSKVSISKFKGVNIHLHEAISKLSDKTNPDYRNSIKESISAVESLCQLITNEKLELSKALKILKQNITFHPALLEGFLKIYGYTSDGDGIRHSLTEESVLDLEDAIFMLVSCSAFINYLMVKADKAKLL